jgi:hypothetical protein
MEPMNPTTREPQAPESYATFWTPTKSEPVATDPAGSTPREPAAPTPEATDAYSEFVNVTEDTPAPARTSGEVVKS